MNTIFQYIFEQNTEAAEKREFLAKIFYQKFKQHVSDSDFKKIKILLKVFSAYFL